MGDLVQTGSKYSDADRRRAALEYSLSGSLTKVAKSMGIPLRTVCDWKNSEWWDELVAGVRQEKDDQILAANEEILELAQRELLDRLENGDTQLVRTRDGVQAHRIPVKAKELAIIGGVSFDKRQIGLNKPTSISSNSGTTAQLAALAKQFEALAGDHKRIERSVVSVHEEAD